MRAISICLLFIILVSTSSFSLEYHYCNGKLSGVSVFGKPECKKCASRKKEPRRKCCKKKKKSEPCCDYKTFLHEGLNFPFQLSVNDFDNEKQNQTVGFTRVYELVYTHSEKSILSSRRLYSPPIIIGDVQSQFQVYII